MKKDVPGRKGSVKFLHGMCPEPPFTRASLPGSPLVVKCLYVRYLLEIRLVASRPPRERSAEAIRPCELV